VGKKRREAKKLRKAMPKTWKEALRFLPGLAFRIFLVMFGLTGILLLLDLIGLHWALNPLVQLGTYLIGYFAFQSFILGPHNPYGSIRRM
jgi:O-antigen/teichoic acid export membrane protein